MPPNVGPNPLTAWQRFDKRKRAEDGGRTQPTLLRLATVNVSETSQTWLAETPRQMARAHAVTRTFRSTFRTAS